MFTETQALLAAATYDSIREYYASVHLPLRRGLICYAEELKEANENYSSQIDSWLDADYGDEDGVQEDLETIIRCRNRLNNIEEWGPATYALDHTLEQMQWKIEEKLERIEMGFNSPCWVNYWNYSRRMGSSWSGSIGVCCRKGL